MKVGFIFFEGQSSMQNGTFLRSMQDTEQKGPAQESYVYIGIKVMKNGKMNYLRTIKT